MVEKRLEADDGRRGDYLEGTTQARIRKSAGFVKGRHFVPLEVNAQASALIGELATDEIAGELQKFYELSKRVFGLRRRQTKRDTGEGYGSLSTKYFHYSVHAEQHTEKAGDYVIIRRLELPGGADANELDAERGHQLDSIFGAAFDKVVVEVDPGAADFDRLVEMFEDLEEADGGRLRDEEDLQRISYVAKGGASIIVDLAKGRVELIAAGAASCSRLLALARHYKVTISGTVNLLSPDQVEQN